MGIHSSSVYEKKKKALSLISLNYSGILLSPFQFFSKQNKEMNQIQNDLSAIYKTLLKKQHAQFEQNKKQNKFNWNIGKIDQKMQKQRYSPLYNKEVGIQNNKLMNIEQFQLKWHQIFDQSIQYFQQKGSSFKYSQEEKRSACQFDVLCYKSILVYVFKQLRNLQFNKIQQLQVDGYKSFMRRMFSKSFLNESQKLKKTFQAMQKQEIDIVFAQQTNETLIEELQKRKQYIVFRQKNSESIIVLKRQKFNNFYSATGKNPLDQMPQLKKQLSWNDDTVIVFVDNLILISGHLSSKKQKNPQQVYQMIESLKTLNSLYPMCHIITGCDVNSYAPDSYADYCRLNGIDCTCNKYKNQEQPQKNNKIQLESSDNKITSQLQSRLVKDIEIGQNRLRNNCFCFCPQNCQIYPRDRSFFTTSKQRTYLQPQVKKAQELVRVCRDHLIIFKGDNISIQKTKVCTILDRSPEQMSNLPCQEHPYDHYVVKALLTVNVMTHFEVNNNGN